jgi:hypothetical protein
LYAAELWSSAPRAWRGPSFTARPRAKALTTSLKQWQEGSDGMDVNEAQNSRVLRVGIDGRWEASEFAQSLSSLDRLYSLKFGLHLAKQEFNEFREFFLDDFSRPISRSGRYLANWARLVPLATSRSGLDALVVNGRISPLTAELLEPEERLVLRRVIYGSEGIKDLAGIGEIVGHVKDLLLRLIDLWSTRNKRTLESERLELENRKLQVEVAKDFVGLARDLGYTQQEVRQLVAAVMSEQQPLVQLISAGKITSADSIDEDQA